MMRHLLFLFLFFVIGATRVQANPAETLQYVTALLDARIQYNEWLERFMINPAVPHDQKAAVFEDILGISSRDLTPVHLASAAPSLRETLQDTVRNYRSVRNLMQPEYFRPILDRVDSLLTLFPSFGESSAEIQARDPLRRAYIGLWVLLEKEEVEQRVLLRTPQQQRMIRHGEVSGFSEVPFLRKALRVLETEAGAWWPQFVAGFEIRFLPQRQGAYELNLNGFPTGPLCSRLGGTVVELTRQALAVSEGRVSQEQGEFLSSYLMLHDWHQNALAEKDKVAVALARLPLGSAAIPHFQARLSVWSNFLSVYVPIVVFQKFLAALPALDVPVAPLPPEVCSAAAPRASEALVASSASAPELLGCASGAAELSLSLGGLAAGPALDRAVDDVAPEDVASRSPTVELEEEDTGFDPDQWKRDLAAEIATYRSQRRARSSPTPAAATAEAPAVDPRITRAKELLGHAQRRRVFETLFDDRQNHMTLSFDEVKSLVEAFDGRIAFTSSHFRVVLPGSVGFAWRPHGRAHASRLPQASIEGFQKAFTRAGITPALLD